MPSARSLRQILIVEDDLPVADVLQAALEGCYHVDCVGSVSEACALLRTTHIDVALIDSILPDGHGTEVAELARLLGTRVVWMSGYPDEVLQLEACGAVLLQKPFSLGLLRVTLRMVLTSTQ